MTSRDRSQGTQTTLIRAAQLVLTTCCLAVLLIGRATAAETSKLNFDLDWKFMKADPAGASVPGFDDRGWTNVSAPHTYNDVDTFDHWSVPGHRGEQGSWGGRTWYRKTFDVPASFKGKKVYIEFEGVRQVAEVYLNGKLLGTSKTGFIPFGFDLTPGLKFDAPNVLAVMCDNRFMKDPIGRQAAASTPATGDAANDANMAPPSTPNLGELSKKVNAGIPEDVDAIQADQIPWNNPHWHPAHGGIYRDVYLHVVDLLHISLPLYSFLQTAGPYVYATNISDKSAAVAAEIPVENGRDSAQQVEVRAEVFDRDNVRVLTLTQNGSLAPGASATYDLSGTLANPQLWEPDYAYVYRVVCSVRVGGKLVDSQEIPLGIRTVRFDVQTGFYINGHHLKLHGWGQKPTDEWPGLGAAQPDWMHFYTVELMKEAGGNEVRWGHCAAGPALIKADDMLGMITEQPGLDGESDTRGAAWKIRAAGWRDMIIYYRNHPSIIIWEGGNQKVIKAHAAELRGYTDKYDPHGGRAYAHRRADQVDAQYMDVGIGTEGGREIAQLPVVEGEYDREESPRRVWDDYSPPNYGYPEARGQTYDLTSEQFAVNEVAQYVRKLGAANHSGGANWIFSDSTSGGRVSVEVARAGGEVDGVRLPKEAYYVCQTMFRDNQPEAHIIGHWNYTNGTVKTVYVSSNTKDVELFVNHKSVGHGTVSDRYLFTFPNVVWEPGVITAVGYGADGKAVVSESKHTIGPPVRLRMTIPVADPGGLRADGADIALIDVEAVDAKDERCPTFQQRVDFTTKGPGIWRGGYNSGKTNSINNPFLDLECGINRVAVRTTRTAGTITVRATCEGLRPASITVRSLPVKTEDGFTHKLPAMPAVVLPAERPAVSLAEMAPPAATGPVLAGHFTKSFSYSGPTGIVHLEADVEDGKNVYVDRDFPFAGLPVLLTGADYVQGANNDRAYSAVDLMEIAVKGGSVVYIAYDERLDKPEWLSRQFQPTDTSVVLLGKPMKVFQHRSSQDESLTLGSNAEGATAKAFNMYLVFVNAAPK
jgi:beta-galactosidase